MALTGVQFAVSPLHDRDLLVNGDLKKAHWHMIVIFDGPSTFLTAASFREITHGPYPKDVRTYEGHLNILRIKMIPIRLSIHLATLNYLMALR